MDFSPANPNEKVLWASPVPNKALSHAQDKIQNDNFLFSLWDLCCHMWLQSYCVVSNLHQWPYRRVCLLSSPPTLTINLECPNKDIKHIKHLHFRPPTILLENSFGPIGSLLLSCSCFLHSRKVASFHNFFVRKVIFFLTI